MTLLDTSHNFSVLTRVAARKVLAAQIIKGISWQKFYEKSFSSFFFRCLKNPAQFCCWRSVVEEKFYMNNINLKFMCSAVFFIPIYFISREYTVIYIFSHPLFYSIFHSCNMDDGFFFRKVYIYGGSSSSKKKWASGKGKKVQGETAVDSDNLINFLRFFIKFSQPGRLTTTLPCGIRQKKMMSW